MPSMVPHNEFRPNIKAEALAAHVVNSAALGIPLDIASIIQQFEKLKPEMAIALGCKRPAGLRTTLYPEVLEGKVYIAVAMYQYNNNQSAEADRSVAHALNNIFTEPERIELNRWIAKVAAPKTFGRLYEVLKHVEFSTDLESLTVPAPVEPGYRATKEQADVSIEREKPSLDRWALPPVIARRLADAFPDSMIHPDSFKPVEPPKKP